jgi:hypothetical protein
VGKTSKEAQVVETLKARAASVMAIGPPKGCEAFHRVAGGVLVESLEAGGMSGVLR